MKKITFATMPLLFLSTSALADNDRETYFAIDFGSSSYSTSSTVQFPSPKVVRLAIGHYFGENIALEGGYTKFGDSSVVTPTQSATISASSFQIATIVCFPLNPQFDLFGKLGIAHNITEGKSSLGFNATDTVDNVIYGIGVKYHINSKVSLRLQYEDYGDLTSGKTPLSATAISLGVLSNF